MTVDADAAELLAALHPSRRSIARATQIARRHAGRERALFAALAAEHHRQLDAARQANRAAE